MSAGQISDFFLGVDGGGTKTRFALIDGERRLLGLVTKMDLIDIIAGRRTQPTSTRPAG